MRWASGVWAVTGQPGLTWLCLLTTCLHSVFVVGDFADRVPYLLVADSLYVLSVASAALLALAGWRRENREGNPGLEWYVLGMGALLLAEAWMTQYHLPGRVLPGSSVADPLYILSYLGTVATLLRFNGLRGWSVAAWGALLDSLIVVVLLGELAWIGFLSDLLAAPGSSLLRVFNLAYVGLDLLLIGLTLLSLRRRFSVPLSLFGVGVVGFVVADLLYLNLEVHKQYVAGTPLDALWTWGTAFQTIGIVWAWRERAWESPLETAEQLVARRSDRMLRVLPYLAMAVGCGLLLYESHAPLLKDRNIETWSAVLFGVVMLRQAVSFWESDRLQRELLARTQELRHQALHDPLTGLHNRAAFEQELRQALDTPSHEPLVLLYLDLDDFKPINDALGHAAGDQALRWVADTLRASLPPEAFVARLGGDEFTVLWRGAVPSTDVTRLAEQVRRTLGQPLRLETATVRLSASVGGVLVPAGRTRHPDTLWREADQAMYRVKRAAQATAQAESSAEADPKRAAPET